MIFFEISRSSLPDTLHSSHYKARCTISAAPIKQSMLLGRLALSHFASVQDLAAVRTFHSVELDARPLGHQVRIVAQFAPVGLGKPFNYISHVTGSTG